MAKRRFEERFIAFVDILGFSDIVQRMSRDERLFTTIRDALQRLDQQSREFRQYRRKRRDKNNEGKVPLVPATDLQMTAFSDCYVISEVFPAWHVLAAVQALGSRFLAEGILTRGGVVRGGSYHSGRVLFGPGIVDAYDLESKVAKYPRILVSEPVREEVRSYHEGVWKGQLLQHDVDGCWFVNLLVPSLSSWSPVTDPTDPQSVRSHLRKVRQALTQRWREVQGNPEHMSKVWWLIHRFNQSARNKGLEEIERNTH